MLCLGLQQFFICKLYCLVPAQTILYLFLRPKRSEGRPFTSYFLNYWKWGSLKLKYFINGIMQGSEIRWSGRTKGSATFHEEIPLLLLLQLIIIKFFWHMVHLTTCSGLHNPAITAENVSKVCTAMKADKTREMSYAPKFQQNMSSLWHNNKHLTAKNCSNLASYLFRYWKWGLLRLKYFCYRTNFAQNIIVWH